MYNNGKNCCAVNFEDWDWTKGDKCDGSALQRDSLCCQFNKQIACPSEICDSYSQGEFILKEAVKFDYLKFPSKFKEMLTLSL